ncbi:MAG: GH116 family glycosyl hydrolase, partial [Gillisia sp.]
TLGGTLANAADAIWENPAYLHGAVAWRIHLNAWRGAYAADLLGWHERAKSHFNSYANSQVLSPPEGPVVPDTSRFFARQQERLGTAMFSRGYISRHPNDNTVAHHYDMNLVFIDQLLTHFQWTGDRQFLKKMWPVIKRHLAWEKRNFDADGDGLYDAYAALWASDALQYSGGGVTYTSVYNYRANKIAAELAKILGEDPEPYLQEAQHIYSNLQKKLWLPKKGVYAEYKDLLGEQLLHKEPGVWTVYHSIDKKAADKFQAYQELNYIDTQIPHIPVAAEGLDEGLYLLSTTNWQPYTWSVNNVTLAENLNAALAFWQGGDTQAAFKLWKSAVLESMYLSASPGNFEQLSFYDAARGELYRDFGDPIGVAARALVEGLFGIHPDALKDTLTIEPGFPAKWKNASLKLPDISVAMKMEQNRIVYHINPNFPEQMNLRLKLILPSSEVENVLINGSKIPYRTSDEIGSPELIVEAGPMHAYEVKIELKGEALEQLKYEKNKVAGGDILLNLSKAEIIAVKDPQNALQDFDQKDKSLDAKLTDEPGDKVFFLKLHQGDVQWWAPIKITLLPEVEIASIEDTKESVLLRLQNNSKKALRGTLDLGEQNPIKTNLVIPEGTEQKIKLKKTNLGTGTNKIDFQPEKGKIHHLQFQSWDIPASGNEKWDMVELSSFFNSKVTDVFKNQYFSPRPDSPTLQLPTTGVGNWCYPSVCEDISIDDSGLRRTVGKDEKIIMPQGIPFQTPSAEKENNILFTSQWDVYPQQVEIPLLGKASHAYFLLAGTTNPMQSRLVNGKLTVTYEDGTKEVLLLKNPENWWPVEQDYYVDGFAFTTDAPLPPRVYFKTGKISRDFSNYVVIHGFSDHGIDGGAGTVLDLPLNSEKSLQSLTVSSVANDVVVGLMSLTLKR